MSRIVWRVRCSANGVLECRAMCTSPHLTAPPLFLILSLTLISSSLLDLKTFLESFSAYLTSARFSDFTVVLPRSGRRFPCHKLFLAAESEFFQRLFQNSFAVRVDAALTQPTRVAHLLLCDP